jgi:hypothetical protein
MCKTTAAKTSAASESASPLTLVCSLLPNNRLFDLFYFIFVQSFSTNRTIANHSIHSNQYLAGNTCRTLVCRKHGIQYL